jgi:hypothetical protein
MSEVHDEAVEDDHELTDKDNGLHEARRRTGRSRRQARRMHPQSAVCHKRPFVRPRRRRAGNACPSCQKASGNLLRPPEVLRRFRDGMAYATAALACTGIVTVHEFPFMVMSIGSVEVYGICTLTTIGYCLETAKTVT